MERSRAMLAVSVMGAITLAGWAFASAAGFVGSLTLAPSPAETATCVGSTASPGTVVCSGGAGTRSSPGWPSPLPCDFNCPPRGPKCWHLHHDGTYHYHCKT